MKGFEADGGVTYRNRFRVVFCTKYGREVLSEQAIARAEQVLKSVAAQDGVEIKELEIHPSYVQMFIEFNPKLALHNVVVHLQRKSAGVLREEFPELKSRLPSLWSRNYLACSTGKLMDGDAERYVMSQKGM